MCALRIMSAQLTYAGRVSVLWRAVPMLRMRFMDFAECNVIDIPITSLGIHL
jgi:hypothetical protein